MTSGLYVALAGLALACLAVWQFLRAWFRYRGPRVVTCPETQATAGVALDASHAAFTTFYRTPQLRLSECSRWPERAGCGQECLRQIELAPEDCLVRNILIRWYQGKVCAFCQQPLDEIDWLERRPALLVPGQKTVEWSQVPAAQLPSELSSALPVCWRCHTVQTFRREHPDLIIDRSRTWP